MREDKVKIGLPIRQGFKLQTKLSVTFSALAILTAALLTFSLYLTVRHRLREDARERLRIIASLAALQIDGDAHSHLLDPRDETTGEYANIKQVLQRIRDSVPGIRYVYTWRVRDGKELLFVVDAEEDPNEVSHIGDIYSSEDNPAFTGQIASLKGPLADKEFDTDKWGVWLSGYAPFYRSNGTMEGILGIDRAASDVVAHEHKFLKIALVVFGAIIPFAIAAGLLLGAKLTAPIVKLTVASEYIAGGDLSYRAPVQNGDEIGMLAASFNRMTQKLQDEIVAREQEIAERRHAELKLAELNRELEATIERLYAANRELAEVAHLAAHDLKTPARAVGSLASMIRTDFHNELEPEVIQRLDLIVARAQRMCNLLDGMLEYCSLERIANHTQPADLNDIVRRVITAANIPSHIEIVCEKLPAVAVEKHHAVLLFRHLIDNAVKFMDKPEGQIRIAWAQKGAFVTFSVADNGPGIEMRYFAVIFKLFQTLGSRDEKQAVGIGLAMVKKIVEMYNGVIWLESQPGKGSTFYFALPAALIKSNVAVRPEPVSVAHNA